MDVNLVLKVNLQLENEELKTDIPFDKIVNNSIKTSND